MDSEVALTRQARAWLSDSALGVRSDSYARYLTERGYSLSSVRNYLSCIAHFAHWLKKRRATLRQIDEALVQRFLDDHLQRCSCPAPAQRCRHQVRAALKHLLVVLRLSAEIPTRPDTTPESIREDLRRFDARLDRVCGLAAAMRSQRSVGRRYVQYFNWHYKRTGTLWEGRYRATIVDAENYLFECMRYIELNPVRAGMVAHPRQYSWSSYRCNAEGRTDPLVSQHSLYRGLAREENERQGAYRTLVKGPMDAQTVEAIRTCTNKGWALGSQKFQSKIERLAERRAVPLSKGRPKSITTD